MQIQVVTLFPELFESPLSVGLVGKALREQRASVGFVDPRSFATDKHRSVDDSPYGGGAGMVMKVDVLAPAIEEARRRAPCARVILLCPQGRPFDQRIARRLASETGLVLVAGRYEGFDERVRALVDEELSIGDFVLTGGELAALSIIDAVVRLRPGTLGNVESAATDSFEEGLLEHPQYTRPPEYRGQGVPELLLGGDHAAVAAWRRAAALVRTKERRPDLLAELPLSEADQLTLGRAKTRRSEIALAVEAEDATLARAQLELAEVYELEAVHFLAPESSVAEQLRPIIEAFASEPRAPSPRRRANAQQKLEDARQALRFARRRALGANVFVHRSLAELLAQTASATWIGPSDGSGPPLGPRALRAELLGAPEGARFLLTWPPLRAPAGVRTLGAVWGRASALNPGNTGASGLAAVLDRLLGEG